MSRQIFQNVQNNNPPKSVFDLSYSKLMTADMGYLYPVMCDEVVPGDRVELGNQIIVRMSPLVSPVLTPIYITTHYFFVPYRILWNSWEDFITGGQDGDDASVLPRLNPHPDTDGIGGILDYLGYPLDSNDLASTDSAPLSFPVDAYVKIYNEYYRDQNLIDEKVVNDLIGSSPADGKPFKRAWEKDYFTSALPWQQRGTAPSIPLTGTTPALFSGDIPVDISALTGQLGSDNVYVPSTPVTAVLTDDTVNFGGNAHINQADANANTVDFSDAGTFDVTDLRYIVQVQRWLEMNARAGVRYTEFLKAHFGVAPRDERLDRPEYIGGTKAPLIVSEVVQTSGSNYNPESGEAPTPQGNLAGHGITAGSGYAGKYNVQEYGLVMGIMSICPKPTYASQGVNRQWLRKSKYDFFFPEFTNLSEQAIKKNEIYADGTATDQEIFGYQGQYDEMRTKQNMICGLMRTDFEHWHLSRKFASHPALNESFIEIDNTADDLKRIFAVENEPGFIINFGNIFKAIRPLPITAEPGRLDHRY